MKLIRRIGLVVLLTVVGAGLVTGAVAKSKSPASNSVSRTTTPDAQKRVTAPDAKERVKAMPADAVPITTTEQDPAHSVQDPAAYEVTWQTISAGGGTAASADYSSEMTIGESVIGESSSDDYDVSIGAMYMFSIIYSGCDCSYQGDYDSNTFLDAVDLNGLIDALFFGGFNPQDPDCPTTRGDVTADGFPDAVDLNYLIDHLFFGGPAPVSPC